MFIKSNNFYFLICLVSVIFCLGCNKDSNMGDLLGPTSRPWISHAGLDRNTGELSINDANDYHIVGSDYILKVDVNGSVTEEIQDPFSAPESGLFAKWEMYDEKIYRITSIGFSNEDDEQKMGLEIYGLDGNLTESLELDARYTLIDVVMEEDKITLLTWDWNDPNTLGARTHIFQVDYDGQLLFDDRLSALPEITGRVFDFMQLADGNFLFDYDKTLYKVNNQFEPIASLTMSNTIHEYTEDADGNIYVAGIISDDTNYITKLDSDLNVSNEISFNNELMAPLDPALSSYAFGDLLVDGDNLYTMEVAFEYGQELRIQCFDLDLNKHHEFILEGSGPLSDLVLNELGSVSFLYGLPNEDLPNVNPTEVRLFKIGTDCQIPELIIEH